MIIVDDGSTDDTPALADSFAGRDGRVRVVHTANGGLATARNNGLNHSRGEYVTFLDADDTLFRDALSDMLRAATESGAEITSARITKRPDDLGSGDGSCEILTPDDMLVRVLRQRDYTYNSSLCGKLFRTKLFDNNHCTPGTAYEDLDLMPRLIAASSRIAVVRKNLYYYRQHPDAFTHGFTRGRLHALEVTGGIEEWLDNYDPGTVPFDLERCRAAARDRHFSAAFNIFNLLSIYEELPDDSHDLRGTGHDSALLSAETLNEYRNRCLSIIRQRRREVLFSSQARLKNRLGALLSYFGSRTLRAAARLSRRGK